MIDTDALIQKLKNNIRQVIRGKEEAIDLLLACLLARGHLLIEDVPGVGKTTLAQTLAASVGCTFRRIQFTADMLPSDLLGVSIFNQKNQEFEFRPGPLFANIVLADEINRASPRTQSALLEAMSENQITVDQTTYPLTAPFMVIATQNPHEHHGTYPLPDSQMDRFLMRIPLGYPPPDIERALLQHPTGREAIDALQPVLSAEQILQLQKDVDAVRFEESLEEYLYFIVEETRRSPLLAVGVSTRGVLAFHRTVRAFALIQGRRYVIPDDPKNLVVPCLAHRILTRGGADANDSRQILHDLVRRIPIPL